MSIADLAQLVGRTFCILTRSSLAGETPGAAVAARRPAAMAYVQASRQWEHNLITALGIWTTLLAPPPPLPPSLPPLRQPARGRLSLHPSTKGRASGCCPAR